MSWKLLIKQAILGVGCLASTSACLMMAPINLLISVALMPVAFGFIHFFLKTTDEILSE